MKLPENDKDSSLETLNSNPLVRYCSADTYFMKEGVYEYDYSKINEAHDTCLKQYLEALSDPTNRLNIVDNTNTENWEYGPLPALARIYGYEIRIIEVHRDVLVCIRENKHQVPANVIKAQYRRFEQTPNKFNVQIVKEGKLPSRLTNFYRRLFRRI